MNSVPFPEDRDHILRIVAALCEPETVVCMCARSTQGSSWDCFLKGEGTNERSANGCQFRLAMERGLQIGDLTGSPKIQKFYEPDEWKELIGRFFAEARFGHSNGMVTALCRKALFVKPADLAQSLRFDFNLPYPGGRRMEASSHALRAFSRRLGVNLEKA